MKKIAIFGGSFNPIHFGHLDAAKQALRIGFDEIWFVPCCLNPLKEEKPLFAKHRIQMIKLAIKGNKKFKVKDFEIKNKIKYTIDSIHFLKKNFPRHDFFLFLGKTLKKELKKWRQSEKLLKEINIFWIEKNLAISSSKIRVKISKKRSIAGLVPKSVEQYVEKNELYR